MKPPFLGNASSGSGSPDKPPFDNRPQKTGTSNTPDGGGFPNRAQPMKSPTVSPESVPAGGTLPYKGAPTPVATPFKLGK